MTVAFLCDYYHPFEIGGAERSAERLAVELERRGTTVVVLTPNYGAPAAEIVNGVAVERLWFPQTVRPGTLARRFWLSNPLLHAAYVVSIAARLRRHGVRVLHVQNSTFAGPGVAAARLARAGVVVTVRDLGYLPNADGPPAASGTRQSIKWRLDAWWARLERVARRAALRRASAVIFVSAALRDLYAASVPHGAARAHVIYNVGPSRPVDARAPREPRTVAFVGKLSTGKGLHVLYDAAALVARRFPDVRFEMAGSPGVGFAPAPAAVAPLFTFRGRLDAADVGTLMARAALLVSPGTWPEPLSRVLLEAMSAGLPIVATSVGGNAEVLEHGRSGWLVPAGDAGALADGMCALLDDSGKAASLAAGARARFEALFSPDAILPRVLDVYAHAAGR